MRDDPWPGIGHEELPSDLAPEAPVPRTARRRHRGPYRAALVPSIAATALRLPPSTAAAVDDAAAAIARFDTEMGAEIAPFAAVLLRSESAASSKIENLTASARAIAEAELGPYGGANARQVVANVRAMTAAVALAQDIGAGAILEMHHALLAETDPAIAGRWRQEQVWIGGSDHGPHGATFVPPHHRHIAGAVDDLVAFIDRDDVPVVAHAAVAHAQLETIHPFSDGNGRTGRALLHAHLRNKGLTRYVTVPVSAGLLTDTDAYFDALTAYRTGDPIPIVDRVVDATFTAIANGRQLVDDLHHVRAEWQERIRARRGANAWRVADTVLRHPVVNAKLLAAELGIALPNVYRAIEPLATAGALIEFTDKKRNRLWRAPDVLEALDAFAARSGRRHRSSR
jgi:Fic family protein